MKEWLHMAKKIEAMRLPNIRKATPKVPVIGVFATSDPRIDKDSRTRCQNIVQDGRRHYQRLCGSAG